jgi:hypothetical protein
MTERRPIAGTVPWMKHMLERPHVLSPAHMSLGIVHIRTPSLLRVILTDANCHDAIASTLLLLSLETESNLDVVSVILSTWDLREEFAEIVLTRARSLPSKKLLVKNLVLTFHEAPRVTKHRLAVSWNDSRESTAHLYVTLRLLDTGLLRFGAAMGVQFVRFATMMRCLPGELQQWICCRAMCFEAEEHCSWSRGTWVREESYGNALLYWLSCEGVNRS